MIGRVLSKQSFLQDGKIAFLCRDTIIIDTLSSKNQLWMDIGKLYGHEYAEINYIESIVESYQ